MSLPTSTPSDPHGAGPQDDAAPGGAEGDNSPEGVAHRARIRSFVVRAGRMGTGQIKALAELGPRYVLPFEQRPLDTAQVFGRQAPVVLEIGFGMGGATAQIAQSLPDHDFIGCEVHEPGVGALLKLIGEQDIPNIRIFQHDAVEVLEHMIPEGSLAGVHIFFPDPWHKKRHNKRRLIQPPFVAKLVRHLAPGGYLHCATDWAPYAEQMLEVLGADPDLVNTAPGNGYAEKPTYRPLTKFENRGLKLGHGVWDLVFRRK
ncbi:tRNA (guanosine(46)-N7)-methyltransferase TrmB [Roseateles terrae]|uniref:tRNA (guanine-N(7)-)-methyltransferase n=1 Tax=Roseateles terrae TaxID=431060 RepID=A0ABR6GX54_9BURK|nr:tRNA (guanosine(46)-N7)-methyltransferase TrmB [Roseateles terrae]MBB3196697.1 tRNA (guanine-N7-)-methyltransferase [Roseateles terrae]OWQ84939.1 tRNA (guanosine(46)-N7)-methyltransferase TrmB [Roseateles terrae]